MEKIIFVTYASGSFKKNIFWNKLFVKLFIRPDKCFFYTDEDLIKTKDYHENRNIFDAKKGGGFWAWKPWAISQAYKEAGDGDIVIYQDCGAGFRYKNFIFPRNLINYARDNEIMPGVLIPEHGINAEWTHEDCFKVMDCDSAEFHNTPQVEAVISLWKVGTKSSLILEEWKQFCLTEKAISDVYLCDSSSFANRGHRYDQSILTNLTLKYRLNPITTDYMGHHMFKSISFLELSLRKEKVFFGFIFWSINALVKIRRKLLFN